MLTASRMNATHAVARVGKYQEKLVQVTTACNRSYEAKSVRVSEGEIEDVDCLKCLRGVMS